MDGDALSGLRQPAYTGENRCLPCTAVNTAIATIASLAAGWAVATVWTAPAGAGTGVVVLALGVALIYLRGYLVPGTPALTRRYFPPWLLSWFGKDPAPGGRESETDGTLDPEAELTAVGALAECPEGSDLCLTPSFRRAWHDELDGISSENPDRGALLELLDIVDGAVEYEEFGDAFRALVEGRVVGTWESRAAYLADLAAARLLSERHPDWDRLGVGERSQLLGGLRLFIDTCPDCGGTPEFGAETVESCCSTHDVAAVSCPECGARLFESAPI